MSLTKKIKFQKVINVTFCKTHSKKIILKVGGVGKRIRGRGIVFYITTDDRQTQDIFIMISVKLIKHY